jgi:hypothetical protein
MKGRKQDWIVSFSKLCVTSNECLSVILPVLHSQAKIADRQGLRFELPMVDERSRRSSTLVVSRYPRLVDRDFLANIDF